MSVTGCIIKDNHLVESPGATVIPMPLVSCPPPPVEPPAPRPSVGRDVHYVSYGTPGGEYSSRCRAAKVTEVAGQGLVDFFTDAGAAPRIGVAVLNPDGVFFHPLSKGGGLRYGAGRPDADPSELCDGLHHEPGTWHWPARV